MHYCQRHHLSETVSNIGINSDTREIPNSQFPFLTSYFSRSDPFYEVIPIIRSGSTSYFLIFQSILLKSRDVSETAALNSDTRGKKCIAPTHSTLYQYYFSNTLNQSFIYLNLQIFISEDISIQLVFTQVVWFSVQCSGLMVSNNFNRKELRL
jgi:hypothetical protein